MILHEFNNSERAHTEHPNPEHPITEHPIAEHPIPDHPKPANPGGIFKVAPTHFVKGIWGSSGPQNGKNPIISPCL